MLLHESPWGGGLRPGSRSEHGLEASIIMGRVIVGQGTFSCA
jgi:hypothetical protein